MPACWEGLHLTTRPGLCFGLLLSGGSAGGWQRSRAGETDMFCSCFDSFSWKRALGKPLWNIAIAARLPWPSSVRGAKEVAVTIEGSGDGWGWG